MVFCWQSVASEKEVKNGSINQLFQLRQVLPCFQSWWLHYFWPTDRRCDILLWKWLILPFFLLSGVDIWKRIEFPSFDLSDAVDPTWSAFCSFYPPGIWCRIQNHLFQYSNGIFWILCRRVQLQVGNNVFNCTSCSLSPFTGWIHHQQLLSPIQAFKENPSSFKENPSSFKENQPHWMHFHKNGFFHSSSWEICETGMQHRDLQSWKQRLLTSRIGLLVSFSSYSYFYRSTYM